MQLARTCTPSVSDQLCCHLKSGIMICFFWTVIFPVNAQTSAYKLYFNAVGDAAHIFTGSAYTAKYQNVKGSPFFNASTFLRNDLFFRGVYYYQVPIKYDLVTQELIIEGSGKREISLPVEKVDSFDLSGYRFVRISSAADGSSALKNAFFQRLFQGKNIELFAYRSRVVHKALRAEDPAIFDVYDSYFIRLQGRLVAVSGERSVKKLLGLQDDQLKTGRDGKRLNWRRDFENSLCAAVENFDRSVKQ